MKVRAISDGFRGGRRYKAGDEFEVPEKAKAKWFVPVEKADAQKPKGAGKKAPETLSEITKTESEAQKPKGADDLV